MAVSSILLIPKLAIFTILSVFCGNCATFGQTCVPGMKETIGYTIPRGDIYVKYGDPLEIYCVLNEVEAEKYGPNPSQYLLYRQNSKVLSKEMVQIVNSTTIKLHVENPPTSKGDNYMCILDTGVKKSSVCMNVVSVGVPPQEITDFSCVSKNLDNLTCTWTAPENYVETHYNVSYARSLTSDINSQFYCSDIDSAKKNSSLMSCVWTVGTKYIYRQSQPEYYFSLKANNIFGTYNMPMKYFEHFKHVVPNRPENLKCENKTWNSIGLSWTVPINLMSFPPGLYQRVQYQSSYGNKTWNVCDIFIKKNTRKVEFKLDNLKYAHAYYDIRVSMLSGAADPSTSNLWSPYAFVNVLTLSKKPDRPPQTSIGSFEVIDFGNNSDRNVRIYWSHIPREERNGENFSYVVSIEGQDRPRITDKAFFDYNGLSPHKAYTFHIWAKNEMGQSDENSVVRVPTSEDSEKLPNALTVDVLGSGHYQLFWNHPDVQKIRNYTIFWCDDEAKPTPCTGTLSSVVVPGNITSYNKSIDSTQTYHFAVSANTDRGSSGMTWIQCINSYDKSSIPKIYSPYRSVLESDSIKVNWTVDCPDKRITGFIIYYCPIVGPTNSTCKESEKNITVPDKETSAKVKNLTPNTTYRMQVAVIINNTSYGQPAEISGTTTLEAAPSTPPTHLRVIKITNSSVEISWRAPTKTNGWLKCYKIFLNNKTVTITPKPDVDVQTTTLTNLTSYETYYITIQACTVECSAHSKTLRVQTEIGNPGIIRSPSMTQNASYTMFRWEEPKEPNGRIDWYELRLREKLDKENVTTVHNFSGIEWGIPSCGKEKKYNSFFFSVRAVNIDKNKTFHGNWSDEVESYCRNPNNYIIYLLVPGTVLFLLAMTYFFKKLYSHYKTMRDVGVKLPQGLQREVSTDITLSSWSQKPLVEDNNHPAADDEEQLLMKKSDGSPNLNVGDSSGCSSAHESVTCSVDSASNISSSDSGTEQPRTPSEEDLSAATTSLRQRNIRPPSFMKPPYVSLPLDQSNINPSKPPKNYCILGVDPNINTESSSSYITLPSMSDKPIYNPDNSLPPPYVVTGELVKTTNPGYVPYKPPTVVESTTRTPSYVVAGHKDVLSPGVSPVESKQSMSSPGKPYVKISDNIVLKNPDVSSWQSAPVSTNTRTGYVGFGELPHAKKETKGYVPHRQFESKALKED